MKLYFIRAFLPGKLYMYQFHYITYTISLQIPSQEAITFANIVFQRMSGFLTDIARIHGAHSFIHSFVRSFVNSFIVRSTFVISIIFYLEREREREREV